MIYWILERSFPWSSQPKYNCYRFWTEREFVDRVKDSFEMKGDDHGAVKLLSDAEMLFFDDLGSTGEGTSDWKKKIIYMFTDERISLGFPTIITTNLTKDQISHAYDARVADRIFARRNTIIDTHDQESRR
jgi:DNA replication protein DnaC